ncbi:hypothetical protein, partial [Nodularia spumigena]|uniref:hypothetical protein n=1 Tax=Nodularia spumigena TaxID=70799 RepID=UPI002B21176D
IGESGFDLSSLSAIPIPRIIKNSKSLSIEDHEKQIEVLYSFYNEIQDLFPQSFRFLNLDINYSERLPPFGAPISFDFSFARNLVNVYTNPLAPIFNHKLTIKNK